MSWTRPERLSFDESLPFSIHFVHAARWRVSLQHGGESRAKGVTSPATTEASKSEPSSSALAYRTARHRALPALSAASPDGARTTTSTSVRPYFYKGLGDRLIA